MIKGEISMKNGKEGVVREIMMGSPVTLRPTDTLDLANDIISLGRIRHIPVVERRTVGRVAERTRSDRSGGHGDLRTWAETQISPAQDRVDQGCDEEEGDYHQTRHLNQRCGTPYGGQENRLCAGGRERNVGRPAHYHRYSQVCGTLRLVRRMPSDVCD